MTEQEALDVLEAALEKSRSGTVGTPAVKAALRALLPLCPERWPLDQFWNTVQSAFDLSRWQNVNASLNGIKLQLKAGRSGPRARRGPY